MSAGKKLSRRTIARYVAEKIESGEGERAALQAAAYLIETKQKHSRDLLVRDIEEILAESGAVVADITSARKLDQAQKDEIAKILKAKLLYTREIVDSRVLGGIKIEAAGKRLDATLKHKIDVLKETGIKKGVA